MNERKEVPYDDLTMNDDQTMSWNDQPFTGLAFEIYSNGQRQSESPYVQGVLQGISREWYSEGGTKEEANYWNGVRHGGTRTWSPAGKIAAEKRFEYGILTRERLWDPNGRLLKDWSIGPGDDLFSILELSREKYAGPQA